MLEISGEIFGVVEVQITITLNAYRKDCS